MSYTKHCKRFKQVTLRQALVVIFTKNEFDLKVKAKEAEDELSYVTRKMIGQFSYMDLQKTKNQIYQERSFLL